jgi:methylmalonyl-CoA mutase
MLAAFTASGAGAAVLCSSDSVYSDHAGRAATSLKQAGCGWVILAGRPEDEVALKAAGVDQFVFAGQDALEALSLVHTALGIGQ